MGCQAGIMIVQEVEGAHQTVVWGHLTQPHPHQLVHHNLIPAFALPYMLHNISKKSPMLLQQCLRIKTIVAKNLMMAYPILPYLL